MAAYLELTLSKEEAPIEDTALTRGTTLGAACARDFTLLATTGSKFHERVFLTEKPQVVKLPLPAAKWRVTHFEISDRTQLMSTVTRLGASINATLCSTVSGQAAFPVQLLLSENPTGVIPLVYPNWPEISAALGVRNARVVDQEGSQQSVVFTHDGDHEARGKEVENIMLQIYNSSWDLRQLLISPFAPSLTKSVMRVPFGNNGTQYSLCAEVVGKHPSLSDVCMEEMFKAAIETEFGDDHQVYLEFLDPTRRGMTAAKFAENVVSALSTLTAVLIPYRADGRTVLLPEKLQTFPSESWNAEATAAPIAGDDCDGAAASITSFVHRVRRLFSTGSPEDNKSTYPYLYAMHRALSHYDVGIAVLGANAANADAAGQNGETHLAGHAMALFVPRLHIVKALHRGAKSRAGVSGTNTGATADVAMSRPDDNIDEITQAHIEALYSREYGIPHAEDELDIILKGLDSIDEHAERFANLQTLAGEGTSAAQSRLYTKDDEERKARERDIESSTQVAALLSPSVASVIKSLDAGAKGKHRFYAQFVELIFDTSSPLMNSDKLLDTGKAHCQLVLVSTTADFKVIQAGVSPKQLVTENFAAVPLYTVDRKKNELLQASFREVQENSLRRSSAPLVLGKEECDILESSKQIFNKLNEELTSVKPVNGSVDADRAVILDVVIPFAALCHNLKAVQGIANLVQMALPSHTTGMATWREVTQLATDASGKDVGAFVSMQLHVDPTAIQSERW